MSPGTGSACLKSVLWNSRKRSARPVSHTCMQAPILLTEEGTALCPSAVGQWRIASHWNGCHLPALLGRHWTCMFAKAWVFRVQLIRTITQNGGGGGHEATETGLAYAPVSQAHGHNHIVQCYPCCTAA